MECWRLDAAFLLKKGIPAKSLPIMRKEVKWPVFDHVDSVLSLWMTY